MGGKNEKRKKFYMWSNGLELHDNTFFMSYVFCKLSQVCSLSERAYVNEHFGFLGECGDSIREVQFAHLTWLLVGEGAIHNRFDSNG